MLTDLEKSIRKRVNSQLWRRSWKDSQIPNDPEEYSWENFLMIQENPINFSEKDAVESLMNQYSEIEEMKKNQEPDSKGDDGRT